LHLHHAGMVSAMRFLLPALAVSDNSYPNCTSGGKKQHLYSVEVTDRDPVGDNAALVSHKNGSSDITFNFATAWFPSVTESGEAADGLVVRVVECNPDHHSCPDATHPEWSNAGALAIIHANLSDSYVTADHVSYDKISWAGATPPEHANTSRWGAADPRMTYRAKDGTYFLTWDNCTQNCEPQRFTLLSTTKDPFDPDGWTVHGPVFADAGFHYTSGASLLFRDDDMGPHLAFVCNSNEADTIFLAESTDGLAWTAASEARRIFMTSRPGCWDDCGVAAGAQPERLSNGDYLYIYNIDTGFPYRGDPRGRCAIGWAILDKDDPAKIVARSDDALIKAEFPWETCEVEGKGYVCQEPQVAFSTGLKPLGNDEFYVLYGAADTDVAVTRIKVNIGMDVEVEV